MKQTLIAIYEDGVLRPTLPPVALPDGATVHLTLEVISPIPADRAAAPPPPQTPQPDEDALRRIREAKTLDELFAALDAAPPDVPDDYDFFEAMNENRRLSGDVRLLYPPELKGISW
jgi:hypothetical protein